MPSPTTFLTILATTGTLFAITASLSAQLTPPAPDAEDLAIATALRELPKLSDTEKAKKLTELVDKYESAIKDHALETVSHPGKLSPPKVLTGEPEGWDPGSDGDLTLNSLFPAQDQQQWKAGEKAVMLGMLLIQFAPEEAFKRMAPRLRDATSTVLDAVRLLSATSRLPGAPLQKPIPKELWLQFYNSPNPCYKILALEKYDSTAQSPEELLKLYRECLFHTFGYLQVRAMQGIHRNKDNRPEVEVLLREFLKSSPVENDGTLPTYPEGFGNPIQAAEYLLLRHLWLRNPDSMSQSDRAKWEQDVRQAKGLPDQLQFEIFSAWGHRDRETLRIAMQALACRHDLTPEMLEVVAQPLRQMLDEGINASPKDEMAATYAAGFLLALQNYPTPEHEELAITLTQSKESAVYTRAAQTLAKIGGPKSVAAVESLAARTRPSAGARDPHHEEVLQALEELKERQAKTPQ